MAERRIQLRRRTLKSGKTVFNHGRSVVDCTVRNLSSAGAMLQLPSTYGIPPRFDLIIEGEPHYSCEIIWRQEQRLGVRFGPQSPEAA